MPFVPGNAMDRGLSDRASSQHGAWYCDLSDWVSSLGVQPTATTSDIVLVASGVDGRYNSTVRRYLGHVLLEDPKRLPMRADLGSASSSSGATAENRRLVWSPERISAISGPAILQVFPFEISKHQTNVAGATLRGFVVRMQPVLRMGAAESSGSDVAFSQPTKPFVGILTIADNETGALSGTESRFRFILPLTPISQLYKRQPGDTAPFGLPHYKDYDTSGLTFPNFTPEGAQWSGAAATTATPIYAESDISVVATPRFLYLFSSTNEFDPVTIWYDVNYGVSAGDPPSYLMSSRSVGWHWEKFGDVLSQPPALTNGGEAGSGTSTNTTHEAAYRYVDTYRNRHSKLSARAVQTFSAANKYWKINGVPYNTTPLASESPDDVLAGLHYPAYEVFETLAHSQPSASGILRTADFFGTSYTGYTNRAAYYKDRATGEPFHIRLMDLTRTDDTTYPAATSTPDKSYTNDLGLAVSAAYDSLNDEPAANPSRVLAAMNLQGLTVVAQGTNDGANTDGLTPTVRNGSKTVLRWSLTTRDAPEIFAAANEYVSNVSADQPMALVPVGDYGMFVGDGPIVRLRRYGGGVQAIEIMSGFHLVGKRAATEVRGALFGVFRDGVFIIEPNTGTPTPVDILSRLVLDMWPDTLSSVQVEYDQSLDAVYILNATTGGVVILWLKTQTVTVLEATPFRHVCQQVFRSVRRVVLVSDTGRFVVPRLYAGEASANGSFTMGGYTNPNFTGANRTYVGTVSAATYSPSLQGTILKFSESAFRNLFWRDGLNYEVLAVSDVDFYYRNWRLYVVSASGIGTPLTVLGYYGVPSSPDSGVLMAGDVTATIAVGTVLAADPVPFGLLFGALASGENSLNGTVCRVAQAMSVPVPWVRAAPASSVPFFESGVIDYADIAANEPHAASSLFWRTGATALQRDRRTTIPASGVTFSTDKPHQMFGAIGTDGATGFYLFPYVRCWLAEPLFLLQEVSVRGRIDPTETTSA